MSKPLEGKVIKTNRLQATDSFSFLVLIAIVDALLRENKYKEAQESLFHMLTDLEQSVGIDRQNEEEEEGDAKWVPRALKSTLTRLRQCAEKQFQWKLAAKTSKRLAYPEPRLAGAMSHKARLVALMHFSWNAWYVGDRAAQTQADRELMEFVVATTGTATDADGDNDNDDPAHTHVTFKCESCDIQHDGKKYIASDILTRRACRYLADKRYERLERLLGEHKADPGCMSRYMNFQMAIWWHKQDWKSIVAACREFDYGDAIVKTAKLYLAVPAPNIDAVVLDAIGQQIQMVCLFPTLSQQELQRMIGKTQPTCTICTAVRAAKVAQGQCACCSRPRTNGDKKKRTKSLADIALDGKRKLASVRKTISAGDQLHLKPLTATCAHCGTPAAGTMVKLNWCARCKSVQYCSAECQKAAWAAHKPNCKAV